MKILASGYYRATMATGEDEIFSTQLEAEKWVEKVRFTFCQPGMTYEIREIKEWIVKAHKG